MIGAITALLNAQELRRELSERNLRYAREHKMPHVLSYGESPVVVYEPFEENGLPCHGNFLPATYEAILANPQWRRRLTKVHTQAGSALPRNGRRWRELDASTSSDALLMNVFCYPRVFANGHVGVLVGADTGAVPEFGMRARVPLLDDKFDRTEVDMRLGNVLVEAKLTESDFQSKPCLVLEAYRDFVEVFDVQMLPRRHAQERPEGDAWEPEFAPAKPRQPQYASYQLIRNVLAAHAWGCAFCVIHDARRPDMREAWYAVMRAVRNAELRTRCKVLTWQELAQAVPPKLQHFLAEKYGV